MILYLDTSSLVKLYIEESYSEAVRRWAEDAETLATCRVAYPETLSAFTRRLKSGDIPKKEYERLITGFSREWIDYAVIDFDELEAGRLVKKHGLRGFDAVHLSAALLLKSDSNEIDLFFTSFDDKLNDAAKAEGLDLLMVD